MSKPVSFCVPFEKLVPVAIAELHKVHPGALPISVEWNLHAGTGAAEVWWVPSPHADPDEQDD